MCPILTINSTTIISVSPAGSALSNTFLIKLPRIISWLGSMAKKKPGTPIVNTLIIVICDGHNGYWVTNISVIIANIKEKIFFTRNKLAERSILLTVLLPSNTTLGILEKSESSSTT